MHCFIMFLSLLHFYDGFLKFAESTSITPFPTIEPLKLPSMKGNSSSRPSNQSTAQPSHIPLNYPSSYPTTSPRNQPTKQPRKSPTLQPLSKPTGQPTRQPMKKPISHPSGQPNFLPSNQPIGIPTCQPSKQPRRTPTHEPSLQPTKQPGIKPKKSPTTQPSRQPAAKPNRRPSGQPTYHPSIQPRRLPSIQPYAVPTFMPSMPTSDPTRLPTAQPFHKPKSKPSLQPSRQPSSQPSMHPSSHPTSQPVLYPKSRPSQQPFQIPTRQPNKFPSMQPSKQPLRVPTGQPLMNPSMWPSSQPLHIPSCQPTCQPQTVPSLQPNSIPSDQPSKQPQRVPTLQPLSKPTKHPGILPSGSPTCSPSLQPTYRPSCQPRDKPTVNPTEQPSTMPSHKPSCTPSKQPTKIPSGKPSHRPSVQPNSNPTMQPSVRPTTQPTCQPVFLPSCQPSCQPTKQPSESPIQSPTSRPSHQPRQLPSRNPSDQPSSLPSDQPSAQPRLLPTKQPSVAPTLRPTFQPRKLPSVMPSRQPLSWPSSEPTTPTAQPSFQPSTQPVRVPTLQPTTQPTSRPSPLAGCAKGSYFNLTGHSDPAIPSVTGLGHSDPVTGYYLCIQCSPGTYSDQIHQRRCKICPKGTFSLQNSTKCTLCARNTYAENNGTGLCTQCNGGEFNGLSGSFSASDCVNPSINFILGSLAGIASMFAIVVYILFGRLHRIAFQRRFRLIRKCIIMYGAVLTTSDMITQAGIMLDALKDAETNKTIWRKVKNKILKPFIIFPFLCLVVLPMVVLLSILQSVTRIIFNAMVLWRAYNGIYIADVNFVVDCLRPFLYEIGKITHSQEVVAVVSYPIVYTIDVISNLSINLSAIKVTCTGAQSPLYLLCDVLIVGIVIIIIESDVNVFWTMMSPTVSKLRSMVFSRHYFSQNVISSLFYLAAAILVTQIPDPSKLIQYSMGFVVIEKFFNLNISPNCDATITYTFLGENKTFPIDSILAYLAVLLAVIALPPVIYMVSVVLFAHTNKSSPSSAQQLNASSSNSQLNSSSQSLSPTWSLASFTLFGTSRHSNIPSTPNPQLDHQSSSLSLSSTPDYSRQPTSGLDINEWLQIDASRAVRSLTQDDEDVEGSSVREEKRSTNGDANNAPPNRFSTPLSLRHQSTIPIRNSFPPSQAGYTPAAPRRYGDISSINLSTPIAGSPDMNDVNEWASPADRDGIHSLHAVKEEGKNHNLTQLSKGLRLVSSFFAVDWLFLKFIFNLGRRVFSSQRTFLVKKFMIHTSYRQYDPKKEIYDPKETRSAVKVFVDAFDYDGDLKIRRTYAEKAKLRKLPWFDGLVCAADNADAIEERTADDKEWKEVEKTLPNFWEMSMEVKEEMQKMEWLDKWLPWSYTYLCYLVPTQILLTKSGRKNWLRVFQTYFGMFLVCFGIWPEWVVKDFKIIERFKKFVELQEIMYRNIGDEIFEETLSKDVFTTIDNDKKVAFGQFVASMCTCRIALLQVAPVLTAFSLFSSSVAGSPLFVLSADMEKELPPVIDLFQPFKDAETMLAADYANRAPPGLQKRFLGYYILINQSRLIQFIINGYSFLTSIAIIFFPKTIFVLTPFLTFIVLHQGILSSLYMMLLLKKLMFGHKALAEEGGDGSPENEGPADNPLPLEEARNSLDGDETTSVAAADINMAVSNNSYIDDGWNTTTRSPNKAKGSLWLQSSSSDSSLLHSPSDIGFNISSSSSSNRADNEVALTPARKVNKLII